MNSVTYLNIYIYGILGFIGATILGCFFFYEGMMATSFVVATSSGQATYYTDNSQYNLYLQGFIYCLTFAVAGFLLLTVMAIPSAEILGRPRSVTPPTSYAPPQPMVAPQAPPQMEAPQVPPPQMVAPQAPPQMEPLQTPSPLEAPTPPEEPPVDEMEEDFEELSGEEQKKEEEDSDVIFGTGQVTEESVVNFIQRNPESALKFLYRKTLDDKPLPSAEEEIYQGWQRRGLSRAWIRDYVLQIMEWKALPKKKPLTDICSEVKDRIFDLMH